MTSLRKRSQRQKKSRPIFLQERPVILVNTSDVDTTRGDVAGWRGLARIIAKKTGARILYADEDTLRRRYINHATNEDYQELLAEMLLEEKAVPEIVCGRQCFRALDKIGQGRNDVFEICDINEKISSNLLDENLLVSHHLTPEAMAIEGARFDRKHPYIKGPVMAVMLVDPTYDESVSFARKIVPLMAHYPESTIYLCGCRRTKPNDQKNLEDLINDQIKARGMTGRITLESYVFSREDDHYNPYKGLIAKAKHFVIWGDSQSLLSEALYSGKTVYTYAQRWHIDGLARKGYAYRFNELAENEPPLSNEFEPVNLTNQIAEKLLERMALQNKNRRNDIVYQKGVSDTVWVDYLDNIRRNFHSAKRLPRSLKRNRAFVQYALGIRGLSLQYFPRFQNDPELCNIAAEQNKGAYRFSGDKARTDPDFMRDMYRIHGHGFAAEIPEPLRDNESFAIRVMDIDNRIFEFLSDRLRHDETFIRHLIEARKIAPRHIPGHMLRERDTLLKIATYNENVITLQSGYNEDITFAFDVVRANPDAYGLLPEHIRNNDALTDLAVESCLINYDHAPWEQRIRKDLVKKVLSESYQYISHIPSDILEENPEIVSAALEQRPLWVYNHLSSTLKADVAIGKLVLKHDIKNYGDLSHRLQTNREIIIYALDNGMLKLAHCIPFADLEKDGQIDTDFICDLVDRYGYHLWQSLPRSIGALPDVLLACLEKTPGVTSSVVPNEKWKDPDFMKKIAAIEKMEVSYIAPWRLSDESLKAILEVRPEWTELLQPHKADQPARQNKNTLNISSGGPRVW